MHNVKLLLVEDDEDDYVLTKDLLDEFMHESYQLEWAKNVDSARAALERDVHDLCLMDYQLGSEDGIQLLQEASGTIFSGPIIMLTGLKDRELDAMALKAGAVDYLVKASLTTDQLERAIRYALARKETEREKVERLRAESASRAKSEFLAHLSHELRTPLTAILGYSDMLYEKIKDVEDKSYLQIINHNGKHLLGLLNDVLDLSKIEAGKLEIENSNVELEAFFTDIYLLMNVKAIDKALAFSVNFHGEIYPSIYLDPTRFRQVALNLIGNAIKFTSAGSVSVDISLSDFDLHENGVAQECLKICVTDTGVGIEAKKIGSIFQPFTQVESHNSSAEKGTGLGLAISRELVNRMNGNLSVSSKVGEGSKFICHFAIDHQKSTKKRRLKINPDRQEARPAYNIQYAGIVLVVDDLLDIRRLIGHIIERTGVEIIYAENGEEACEMVETAMAKRKPIDMILMDIQMPKLNGRSAAKWMRNNGYHQPIIALTASSMKGDRERCLESGFTDFLGKPVESQQIHRLLEKYLKRANTDNVAAVQAEDNARNTEVNGAHFEANRVLLVEDNVDACNVTAMLIEQLGVQVIKAYSASEALEIVAQEIEEVDVKARFDTVLFDVNLPDMNGYEMLTKIQEILPVEKEFEQAIRYVALSGEEGDMEKQNKLGIAYHLLKPVNVKMIQKVLR